MVPASTYELDFNAAAVKKSGGNIELFNIINNGHMDIARIQYHNVIFHQAESCSSLHVIFIGELRKRGIEARPKHNTGNVLRFKFKQPID